jgi:hypothetical protein
MRDRFSISTIRLSRQSPGKLMTIPWRQETVFVQDWVVADAVLIGPVSGGGDAGLTIDLDYKGKELQLQITVDDEGVFTMPWSATVTYRRALAVWRENVCAENLRATYVAKDSDVPRADKPDF